MKTWKDINGYEGLYRVSSDGDVMSLDRVFINSYGKKRFTKGVLLKNIKHPKGYSYVTLSKEGFCKRFLVHRLVAQAFIDNKENKPEVNHINGDKSDNRLDNLEWVTGSENISHAIEKRLIVRKKNQYVCIMKPVRCVELDMVFESVENAARFIRENSQYAVYSSHIIDCAKERVKSAYGYKWQYDN